MLQKISISKKYYSFEQELFKNYSWFAKKKKLSSKTVVNIIDNNK